MCSVPLALSPQQVADAYGLSRRAIYRAINQGELAASKLCGRLRISPGALAEWIAASRVEPRLPPSNRLIRQDTNRSKRRLESLRSAFQELDRELGK
jgi:excisionase family DNA binding protein